MKIIHAWSKCADFNLMQLVVERGTYALHSLFRHVQIKCFLYWFLLVWNSIFRNRKNCIALTRNLYCLNCYGKGIRGNFSWENTWHLRFHPTLMKLNESCLSELLIEKIQCNSPCYLRTAFAFFKTFLPPQVNKGPRKGSTSAKYTTVPEQEFTGFLIWCANSQPFKLQLHRWVPSPLQPTCCWRWFQDIWAVRACYELQTAQLLLKARHGATESLRCTDEAKAVPA